MEQPQTVITKRGGPGNDNALILPPSHPTDCDTLTIDGVIFHATFGDIFLPKHGFEEHWTPVIPQFSGGIVYKLWARMRGSFDTAGCTVTSSKSGKVNLAVDPLGSKARTSFRTHKYQQTKKVRRGMRFTFSLRPR